MVDPQRRNSLQECCSKCAGLPVQGTELDMGVGDVALRSDRIEGTKGSAKKVRCTGIAPRHPVDYSELPVCPSNATAVTRTVKEVASGGKSLATARVVAHLTVYSAQLDEHPSLVPYISHLGKAGERAAEVFSCDTVISHQSVYHS